MRNFLRLAAIMALAALPANARSAESAQPGMVPQADERPIDGPGGAEVDPLFDCYAKFRGDDAKPSIGPPHVVRTNHGFLLRADFAESPRGGVSRLMCFAGGFVTQNGLDVAPLDPPGTTAPDAATQAAFDGWKARRAAEELRRRTAKPLPAPDAQTIKFLEGIWLIGADPHGTPCLARHGYETQIEFEFRKSGGRALIFEPSDAFTPVKISGISVSDGALTLQAEARDGGHGDFMVIRRLDDNRFEIESTTGRPDIAYRCGAPDLAVTAAIDPAHLAAVAPPLSGGWAYIEEVPGVANADLCARKGLSNEQQFNLSSMQFELYGPAHYWIFGWNIRRGNHTLAFDFVRSLSAPADNILKLSMQVHLERGDGWDVPESRGETYELTVVDHGDTIEIPELKKRFARCTVGESLGMHRM